MALLFFIPEHPANWTKNPASSSPHTPPMPGTWPGESGIYTVSPLLSGAAAVLPAQLDAWQDGGRGGGSASHSTKAAPSTQV